MTKFTSATGAVIVPQEKDGVVASVNITYVKIVRLHLSKCIKFLIETKIPRS